MSESLSLPPKTPSAVRQPEPPRHLDHPRRLLRPQHLPQASAAALPITTRTLALPALFVVCLFVGIKPEKLYSASCVVTRGAPLNIRIGITYPFEVLFEGKVMNVLNSFETNLF